MGLRPDMVLGILTIYVGVMVETVFKTIRKWFFRKPKNVAFLIHPLDLLREIDLVDPGAKKWVIKELGTAKKRGMFINLTFAKLALKVIGRFKVEFRGRICNGIFIFIPYLPHEFLDEAKRSEIILCIERAIHVAKDHGAEYVGLGAFTSMMLKYKEGIKKLYKESLLPITSGSSGTAYGNLLGVLEGCRRLAISPKKSTLMILGAGDVGWPTAMLLARQKFRKIVLCARDRENLELLCQKLIDQGVSAKRIKIVTADYNEVARSSHVIVLAASLSSSDQLPFDPGVIQPGTLVLDVGRPRNFSAAMIAAAPYLVIDGSIFRFPGKIEDNSYRFLGMGDPDQVWGCLAETIFRGLDGEESSTSIRRPKSARELTLLGRQMSRCGFSLAALRSNDQLLDPARIKQIATIRRDHIRTSRALRRAQTFIDLRDRWNRFLGRSEKALRPVEVGTP